MSGVSSSPRGDRRPGGSYCLGPGDQTFPPSPWSVAGLDWTPRRHSPGSTLQTFSKRVRAGGLHTPGTEAGGARDTLLPQGLVGDLRCRNLHRKGKGPESKGLTSSEESGQRTDTTLGRGWRGESGAQCDRRGPLSCRDGSGRQSSEPEVRSTLPSRDCLPRIPPPRPRTAVETGDVLVPSRGLEIPVGEYTGATPAPHG